MRSVFCTQRIQRPLSNYSAAEAFNGTYAEPSSLPGSKETPSSTRLCESMNRPAASSETHVAVTRRSGDVPVLVWTQTCRMPSAKSRKNIRSTTFELPSSLQSIRLVLAAISSASKNNPKKLISLDLKKDERTKLHAPRRRP